MAKVIFNEDLCKGCGLCIGVCPKKLIGLSKTRLNKYGHHPAEIVNISECIACAFCALICPDCVIMVER